jgi:hypothetical protein
MRIYAYTLSLLMLAAWSCASRVAVTPCVARVWRSSLALSKPSELSDIKRQYIENEKIERFSDEIRSRLVRQLDNQVAHLLAARRPGDELWYFRERKCAGCGWYGEGFALVRGCDVIDKINFSDVYLPPPN